LQELHRILTRKFQWEEGRADKALWLIREVATEIDPPQSVAVIREKDDDNRILECAAQAKAHYLVSGDERHLLPLRDFQGVSIVSPAEFLERHLGNRGGAR
jgi:predicted nucleic acid-binding protein